MVVDWWSPFVACCSLVCCVLFVVEVCYYSLFDVSGKCVGYRVVCCSLCVGGWCLLCVVRVVLPLVVACRLMLLVGVDC